MSGPKPDALPLGDGPIKPMGWDRRRSETGALLVTHSGWSFVNSPASTTAAGPFRRERPAAAAAGRARRPHCAAGSGAPARPAGPAPLRCGAAVPPAGPRAAPPAPPQAGIPPGPHGRRRGGPERPVPPRPSRLPPAPLQEALHGPLQLVGVSDLITRIGRPRSRAWRRSSGSRPSWPRTLSTASACSGPSTTWTGSWRRRTASSSCWAASPTP